MSNRAREMEVDNHQKSMPAQQQQQPQQNGDNKENGSGAPTGGQTNGQK